MKIIGMMVLLGAVLGGLLSGASRQSGQQGWTQLMAPPEPAIEILGRDQSNAFTTFFRTAGGIYACGATCTKVARLPDPSRLCGSAGSSTLPAPGAVADSLTVHCHGADVTVNFDLVLLKDGRAFESTGSISSWTDVLHDLTAGIMGGAVGLIVGVIIVAATSKPRSSV